MVYQYSWKRNMPIKAQAAGEHLEQLEKIHGKVTSKIVLDSARSEDSLLHPCFEWNDGVAAEKYREKQALFLIGNLTVTVEQVGQNDSPTQAVRAYVNVAKDTEKTGSFIAVKTAMEDSAMRAQVLKNALRELKSFQEKYKNLSELAAVFDAIDSLKIYD